MIHIRRRCQLNQETASHDTHARLPLLSAVLALAGPSSRYAADPIKIGVPVGLSGANSVVAPSVVKSAELAVEEINADGGVLGRQLELEVADDASGAAGAQKAFDALVFRQEGGRPDLDGDQRRPQRRPADRGARQGPYIYTSFYEGHSCSPWMSRQRLGARAAGGRRSSTTSPKRTGAKSFFLVGSDYAFGRGMLEFTQEVHREDRAARWSARSTCRWTAATGRRSSPN